FPACRRHPARLGRHLAPAGGAVLLLPTQPERVRTVLRSRSIRIFAITQFLLEVQFWFPLWLIYLKDLGFSITIAVLADGVFRLVVVGAELPLGILADRLGRKRTYLLVCGLAAVTFAAIT